MWIRKEHLALLEQRAADYREWHEKLVLELRERLSERIADRDSIIAKQAARIEILEAENADLRKPREIVAAAVPEPEENTWEAEMQKVLKSVEHGIEGSD